MSSNANSSPSPDDGPPAAPVTDDEWSEWELPEDRVQIAHERRQNYRNRTAREALPVPLDSAEPEVSVEKDTPPEQSSAPRGPHGSRVPLERKTTEGLKPFTRFVTRPETSVAANLAADQPPERASTPPPSGTAGTSFGKIKSAGEDPTYRPNRLQAVMDEAWTHSRLRWIDQLGKVGTGVLITVVGLGIGALLYSFSREVQRHNAAAVADVAPTEILPSDDVRQAGIRRAFDAFLAAPDTAAKLPYVLEPQRVEARMKEYYHIRGAKDPAVRGYAVSAPMRAAGEWWFLLEWTSADGSASTVLMKETAQGGQLDWENFVAFGSMPWAEFVSKKPTDSQSMRVRLRSSQVYSTAWPEEIWAAYEFAHRDGPPVLTAFAKRASRHGQWLAALPQGPAWQATNLYLRWGQPSGPEAGAAVVEITDLIRNNWLDSVNSAQSTAPAATPAEPAPAARP